MHGIEKEGESARNEANCMDQTLPQHGGLAHSPLGRPLGPSLVGGLMWRVGWHCLTGYEGQVEDRLLKGGIETASWLFAHL